MPEQFAKSEVPPLEHAPVHRRPFRKDDMAELLTYCLERQGVAPNDVPLKDEAYCGAALVFDRSLEQARVGHVECFEEPSSALTNIVREDIDAVYRGDCEYRIALKVELRLSIPLSHNSQLAIQNHGQKIAVTTSGLQESRFDPLRFLLHQIEHCVDLALPGQHLAMIRDSFFCSNLRSLHRCHVCSESQKPAGPGHRFRSQNPSKTVRSKVIEMGNQRAIVLPRL